MGYVHDTSMSRFISPFECAHNPVATWTPTIAANLTTDVRTAANAAFTVIIPILLPGNEEYRKGAYLQSIDVYYVIATEAMDVVAALAIDKVTLAVDGTACAGATVAVTPDAGHDTAAERIDIDEHTMTVTLTTPVGVDEADAFYGSLVCDGGAAGVLSMVGARVNYTLRV